MSYISNIRHNKSGSATAECTPEAVSTTSGGQQLHLSVDVLALGSMKTAARRDIQWELQKHETHQVVERISGPGLPVPSSC